VKTRTLARSTSWTDQKFLTDARDKIKDENNYKIFCELYEFITKHADVAEFGKGSEGGSLTFKIRDDRAKSGLVAIFTLRTFGVIWLRFGNIRNNLGREFAKLYFEKLNNIFPAGILKQELIDASRPRFYFNEVFKDEKVVKEFQTANIDFTKEVKKGIAQ
jgi:hypothetical protein